MNIGSGWCFSSLLLINANDAHGIDPADLAAVRKKYPRGRPLVCFQSVETSEGYELLNDGGIRMRVRDAIVEPIPSPRFQWGERVFASPKLAVCIVLQLKWHLNRKQVYYTLVFGARTSRRWYFETDLRAAGSNPS